MPIFCLYIIQLALEIGQRHSTILLKHHLSSIAVSEGIQPDIFYINREMQMTLVAPCLPRLERVDSVSVPVLNVQFVPVFILYIKSAQNSIRRIPA